MNIRTCNRILFHFSQCTFRFVTTSSLSNSLKMTMIAFGIVEDLTQTDKDYKKLTVAVNTPFKTEVLKFNLWDNSLLCKDQTGAVVEKGDGVKLEYHYKDQFLCLDKLTHMAVDNCPVCFSTLPASDTQRTNCYGCRTLPREEHKTRINKPMTLISVKVKDYLYSSGFRLELQARDDSLPSFAVIFPNKSFYSLMPDLRVGDQYNVLGWKAGKLIDVIDFSI